MGNKKDKIVIDIETSNTFADVGRNNFEALDVSVVVIYLYDEDKYIAYEKNELNKLGERLKNAELIIGFAINRFDLPVLAKYFNFNLFDILNIDILDEIELSSGRRIGLDLLARENLGYGKTGKGLDAPILYAEGKMEELKEYCKNDVKVTKEIYDLAVKQGYLMVPQRGGGDSIKVNLDWDKKLLYQRLF